MVTAETLAALPRWTPEQLARIPGRCRGDLLGPWGRNLARRFGVDAVDRVRRRLAPPLDGLAPELTDRDWLPGYAQIVVTEAIVDELLGGAWPALYPALVEDTRASLGRVELALVRSLGPARTLKLGPRTFKKVHERGTVEVEVTGRRARLTFAGNLLFTNPSWRLLQLFAQRTMLELAGSPGEAHGEDAGPGAGDAFVAVVTW